MTHLPHPLTPSPDDKEQVRHQGRGNRFGLVKCFRSPLPKMPLVFIFGRGVGGEGTFASFPLS